MQQNRRVAAERTQQISNACDTMRFACRLVPTSCDTWVAWCGARNSNKVGGAHKISARNWHGAASPLRAVCIVLA